MNDLIGRLRMLRTEAVSINATLVDYLKQVFGPTKPMFRRLPDPRREASQCYHHRRVTTPNDSLLTLGRNAKVRILGLWAVFVLAVFTLPDFAGLAAPNWRPLLEQVRVFRFDHVC
jgi:hypothetical protein